MSKRASALALIFTAAFAGLFSPIATAQDLDSRVKNLEGLVKKLLDENAGLRQTVDDLQRLSEIRDARDEEDFDEGALAIRSAINELIQSRSMITHLQSGRIFRADDGFADAIVFGAEVRTRADYRHQTTDLIDELDDTGFRLDYRFNLGIGFNLNAAIENEDDIPAVVKTWIEFQAAGRGANNTAEDLRSGLGAAVGDFATRDNELDVVRLYQAYVQLEDIFGTEGLGLKIGRQEINLGSQLIMGTNEFFTGTVHDAIVLTFDIDALDANVTAFYSKEGAPDGQVPPGISTGGLLTAQFRSSGDEDELFGIYSEFKPEGIAPLRFDLYYFFFNGRRAESLVAPINTTSASDPAIDSFGQGAIVGRRHTVGTWIRGDDLLTDGLFLSLEVAYQFGEEFNGTDGDFGALAIDFNAEYRLPFWEEVNARVFAGYYFAEGPDSGDASGFNPLFISRHNNDPLRGHGPFSRLGNVDMIPTQNIHVLQFGLMANPWEDWVLGITYLYAFFNHSRDALTVNAIGTVLVDDRSLGHEVDLYARYSLNSKTDVFFNASIFVPSADFLIDPVDGSGRTKFDSEIAVGLFGQVQVRF